MRDIEDLLPTPETLQGDKVVKEDLLDKVINIKDFITLPSKYHDNEEFAVIQAEVDGKTVTFAGTKAISDKVMRIGRENLPYMAKVVQKTSKAGNKYFDLTTSKQ